MLALQRAKFLDHIKWSEQVNFRRKEARPNEHLYQVEAKPGKPHDGLVAVECWRYEGSERAISDENYRRHWFANKPESLAGKSPSLEDKLEQWLGNEGPSFSPASSSSGGKLLGGLRLILCDTTYRHHGMCMSKRAFEIIEENFNLHSFTLPAAFNLGGAMHCQVGQDSSSNEASNVQFIVRFHQKIEIGSCMLSLTYDAAAGRTDALICGHGFVAERRIDQGYGSLREQVLEAVFACPNWWNNPLLLPSVLHYIYVSRLEKRSWLMAEEVLALEGILMKMFHEESPLKKGHGEGDWPHEVDTRATTIELHTLATHMTYLNGACRWLHDFSSFLLEKEQLLRERAVFREHVAAFAEIRENALFNTSIVDGLAQRYRIYQERANLHVNVLFSIINQQNSALTLLDSRLNILIASSAKQDSIAMTTFTFITAMFLPGTFIATVFSMTMFNWQGGSGGQGGPSGSSEPAPGTVVVDFWIFWATAAPLTLITMAGWYLWSKYARWKWLRDLKDATHNEQNPLTSVSSLPSFMARSSSRGQ